MATQKVPDLQGLSFEFEAPMSNDVAEVIAGYIKRTRPLWPRMAVVPGAADVLEMNRSMKLRRTCNGDAD